MSKRARTIVAKPVAPQTTQSLLDHVSPTRWTRGQLLALGVLAVLGFCSAFSRVGDPDIFWQLACGEWMFHHGRIIDHDCFCLGADPHGWVNVHWFFQVVVTALYKIGGWGLLSWMKGVVAAGIMMTYVAAVRRHVPPAWIVLAGLLPLAVMQPRLSERPELFTFLLLMVSLGLVESVRLGASPRRLWWMTPIMALWVNMHGLFFLGLVVLWGMILGAAADKAADKFGRKAWVALSIAFGAAAGVAAHTLGQAPAETVVCGALAGGVFAMLSFAKRPAGLGDRLVGPAVLAPAVAATLACLISPWPTQAILHPLLLSTRLDDPLYFRGVVELARPTALLEFHTAAVGLTLLTGAVMLLNVRRLPIGHVAISAVFVLMGLLANRNVGMIGPALSVILALHGAAVCERLAEGKPALRRFGPAVLGACAFAAMAISAGYLTGAIQDSSLTRGTMPGSGLQPENYSLGIAKFLTDSGAEGDLLCENFGDGGLFEYYFSHDRDTPRRLVFMDGRLEAHSVAKFRALNNIRLALMKPATAATIALPPRVRFVMVQYDSEIKLAAMTQARMASPRASGAGAALVPRFKPIHVDLAGVLFERMDWRPRRPAAQDRTGLPDAPDLREFDLPLGRDGLVSVQSPRTWYRQNVPPMNYRIGSMLLQLGRQPPDAPAGSTTPPQRQCVLLAVRHLSSAVAGATVPEPHRPMAVLAQAYRQRAWQQPPEAPELAPVNIDLACAMRLFGRVNPLAVDNYTRAIGREELLGALAGIGALDEEGAPAEALAKARKLAEDEKVGQKPLMAAASELASPRLGLINTAIARLRQLGATPEEKLLLGDLLLRKGETAEARQAYAQVSGSQDQGWQLSLRLALCDWVDGRLWEAADALKDLAARAHRPAADYYRLHLAEQLGDAATVEALHRQP